MESKMKYDKVDFLDFKNWWSLDAFINPSAKIYGHTDLMRHIYQLRAEAFKKVLSLKWSIKRI